MLDFINITSLPVHEPQLLTTDATYTAIAEHAVGKKKMRKYKKSFKEAACKIHLSPLSQEKKGCSAGVGIFSAERGNFVFMPPRTKAMALCHKAGRADTYCLDLGGGDTVMIHVIYLWTGSTNDSRSNSRSDDVINAIQEEIVCMPEGPQIIIGDMNAEPRDLLAAKQFLEKGWSDLGAMASTWGGEDCQPTCSGNGAAKATRRDIALASPGALHLVKHFRIVSDKRFPVHATLRLALKTGTAEDQFWETSGSFDLHANYEARVEEELAKNPEADKHHTTAEFKAQLHATMDDILESKTNELSDAARQNDTDLFWKIWSAAIIQAFAQELELNHGEHVAAKKHGKPSITKNKRTGWIISDEGGEVIAKRNNDDTHHRMNKQLARLQQIAATADKLYNNPEN